MPIRHSGPDGRSHRYRSWLPKPREQERSVERRALGRPRAALRAGRWAPTWGQRGQRAAERPGGHDPVHGRRGVDRPARGPGRRGRRRDPAGPTKASSVATSCSTGATRRSFSAMDSWRTSPPRSRQSGPRLRSNGPWSDTARRIPRATFTCASASITGRHRTRREPLWASRPWSRPRHGRGELHRAGRPSPPAGNHVPRARRDRRWRARSAPARGGDRGVREDGHAQARSECPGACSPRPSERKARGAILALGAGA